MIQMRFLLILAAGFASSQSLSAETHYVWAASPAPNPPYTNWAAAAHSLQDAIDAAGANDIVLITNGTYLSTATVRISNDISMYGVSGATATVLSAGGAMRCLEIAASNALISGLTITGGASNQGGGVRIQGGGMLSNCIVRGNFASKEGAGIYLDHGGMVVDSLIVSNRVDYDRDNHGGGVYCYFGGTVRKCRVFGNQVANDYSKGAGIYCWSETNAVSCVVEECEIFENEAQGSTGRGGGVYCRGSVQVRDCTIVSNSATWTGAGFYGVGVGVALHGGVVAFNTCGGYGGGIYCDWGETTVHGTRIASNYAATAGGGVFGGDVAYGNAASALIEASSVQCNQSGGNGGGIYNYAGSSMKLKGCLIAENAASSAGGGAQSCILEDCTLRANSASEGGGADWSTLYGCSLSNNTARAGGGVRSSTLYGCSLSGNSATEFFGGGAYASTLQSCALFNNRATTLGGGAYNSTLVNCTLSSNSAASGGGAYGGSAANSIVYYNLAPTSNDVCEVVAEMSCAPDLSGAGNMTGEPLFVGKAWNDYRLESNSPCINGGTNQAWMVGEKDLAGNPRIAGTVVDIGAYEYGYTASGVSFEWLATNALPVDGSADGDDTDGDCMDNRGEYLAGTNPRDDALRLAFETAPPAGSSGVVVCWLGVDGRRYRLVRGSNLCVAPVFSTVIATNILGHAPMNTYTDTTATGAGIWFYRIKLE